MPPLLRQPMLAMPRGQLDVGSAEWVHEFKWDGIRALVIAEGGRLQMRSRNGNDVAAAWPEFRALVDLLPDGTTLDGEVVVLDDDLKPEFARIAARMHVRDPSRIARLRQSHPGQLMAFDVLEVAGRPAVAAPLEERRAVLARLLGARDGPWATSPLVEDLDTIVHVVAERGLEGVVSKRRGSRYEPGVRSPNWRKWRHVLEVDAVVVGHKGVDGRHSGPVASLAIARWDPDDGWVSMGSVGSGLGEAEGTRLREVFDQLDATDPSPDVRLDVGDEFQPVAPAVVVRVGYLETTPVGHLRHPVYRGQRHDIDPHDVTEQP